MLELKHIGFQNQFSVFTSELIFIDIDACDNGFIVLNGLSFLLHWGTTNHSSQRTLPIHIPSALFLLILMEMHASLAKIIHIAHFIFITSDCRNEMFKLGAFHFFLDKKGVWRYFLGLPSWLPQLF